MVEFKGDSFYLAKFVNGGDQLRNSKYRAPEVAEQVYLSDSKEASVSEAGCGVGNNKLDQKKMRGMGRSAVGNRVT